MIHITQPVHVVCTDEAEALKFHSFLQDRKIHTNKPVNDYDGKSWRFDVYNAGYAEMRDLKIVFEDGHEALREDKL